MSQEPKHIVAISGGKDSTAMALRLKEVEPSKDFIYFITPTGDELPPMLAHWEKLEQLLGQSFTRVSNRSLDFWIEHFKALPNFRQRWCTRLLKIEPAIAFVKRNQPAILYVGLRADEEERKGIYSEDVQCCFPLREWGWGIREVYRYLDLKNIKIPARTDCARCYGQRVLEWKRLWRNYPEIYAQAEEQEISLGKTFRTPGKDNWPTSLTDIRKEFESGRLAPRERPILELMRDEYETEEGACRVCQL